jgi:hypothetical protein
LIRAITRLIGVLLAQKIPRADNRAAGGPVYAGRNAAPTEKYTMIRRLIEGQPDAVMDHAQDD